MSWVDDGPSESNHVPALSARQDRDLANIEYCALRTLWDEFKEAYDRADEEARARLRSEVECYL